MKYKIYDKVEMIVKDHTHYGLIGTIMNIDKVGSPYNPYLVTFDEQESKIFSKTLWIKAPYFKLFSIKARLIREVEELYDERFYE